MGTTEQARRLYAKRLAADAHASDPRLEDAFATIPREDFVGPGPWTVIVAGQRIDTPDADLNHIYSNSLVALDARRNNGEPLLHAMWLVKIQPKPGETVVHVGAGTGYYTAIMARLVSPGGRVVAYEIESDLAARAKVNLQAWPDIQLIHDNAVTADLPPSDIIYVNAGVEAPPVVWLEALKPGGRLIFPWRPSDGIGLAVVVTRKDAGYATDPFMGSWFIPCVGGSIAGRPIQLPTKAAARRSRSIWLTRQRLPDTTATAIFEDVWFSTAAISDGEQYGL